MRTEIDGLCPCGAPPRAGSNYCCDDCVPTHHGVDTISDIDGTGMRWRPDLVTEADDTGRTLLRTFQRGPYRAQVFEYPDVPGRLHLRLDDGTRFVGTDTEPVENLRPVWQRLERELGDTSHLEAGIQWAAAPWQCRLPRRPGT